MQGSQESRDMQDRSAAAGSVLSLLESAEIPAALLRDGAVRSRTEAWELFFAARSEGSPDSLDAFLATLPASESDVLRQKTHRLLSGDAAGPVRHAARFPHRRGGGLCRITVDRADAPGELLLLLNCTLSEEGRYRDMFESAYVSLWEEDIRSLREAAAEARRQGVTDIRDYLRRHPEIVESAARNVRVLDVNQATLELYGAQSKEALLGSLDSIYLEESNTLFLEEIAAVFEGKERLVAETRIRTLTGEERFILMSFAIPRESERFQHVLVSMQDITERRRQQEAREKLLHLEQERRMLARTLTGITLSLTSLRQVDEVLDEILAAARNLVPFESGNIALIREGLVESVRWIGYQESGGEEFIRHGRPALTELPMEEEAIRTRSALIVTDTGQDPRWQSFPGTEWIRSFLMVPIMYREEVRGFLRLDSAERERFSEQDGEKLLPLANAAAVALENARLVEEMEREIGERKSAEERLRRSVEEKEVLVQEIHHRVKNNLAMVLSIINLQMGEHPDQTQVNRSFEELQKRIRAIAAVHEQLHQSGNLAAVHLPTYLHDIVSGLSQSSHASAQGVNISADVGDMTVSPNESVPIGLMVTEAVTNALKHAFPEGRSGWITVTLRSRTEEGDARRAELVIEDNGVGLAGGDGEKAADSLGMLLLHSLAEQLRGTITVEGAEGTRIQVVFPLSEA